jgi:leucyl aminopeptidase
MKLTFSPSRAKLPQTGMLALLALEGSRPDVPSGVKLPTGALTEFKGEFRETCQIDAVSGPARRVLAIGLGKKDLLDAERLRRAGAIAVQRAEGALSESCAILVEEDLVDRAGGPERLGAALAEGAILGAYRFDQRKSKPKPTKLRATTLFGPGSRGATSRGLEQGFERGRASAEANAFARDLQNEPANLLTPRDLASAAKSLVRRGRIGCTILTETDMKRMRMGLLLGVAQGSRQPPRLVHLVYKPRGKKKGKVALVGKGLTFDSGGISIKPSSKMDEMRFDMSGAAAVLGVFHALATLDVPWEVHGIAPCTENMPGGAATKPGDIHTAMNGTTVEILNTDAEGRLVLADALCYAVSKLKPDTIIDLATLTGAVVTALGHEMSGLFATSTKLRDDLVAAGEETGERVWPLPLLDLHKEGMKGSFADLKNISGGDMGAGSSAGAAFLAPFVGDTEWAHLDIAGTAWGGSARDWVGGPMGSGVGTRLLLRWLETR